MSSLGFLIAAVGVTVVILGGYVVWLGQRITASRRRNNALRQGDDNPV